MITSIANVEQNLLYRAKDERYAVLWVLPTQVKPKVAIHYNSPISLEEIPIPAETIVHRNCGKNIVEHMFQNNKSFAWNTSLSKWKHAGKQNSIHCFHRPCWSGRKTRTIQRHWVVRRIYAILFVSCTTILMVFLVPHQKSKGLGKKTCMSVWHVFF